MANFNSITQKTNTASAVYSAGGEKQNFNTITQKSAAAPKATAAQPSLTQRLVNILTGAAKSTGAGVVNALGVASGVSDSYEAAKKNAGVTTHADEERATMYPQAQSGQRSTKELYDTADRLQQQSAQSIGTAKQGLGAVGSTLVDVGVAGTQMLGDAAVNLLAPGAGLAAMGTRAFGNAAQEARQRGATLVQQIGYGAAVGGVEVLTEKMFDGLAGIYGKGAADEVVESVIRKLAKTNGGQNALRVLSSAAGEGIEEIVAGLTEPALQAIFDKQSVASHYDKSTITDALHDAIVGAILGGVGGGFSVARSGAAQKSQNAAPNAAGARMGATEGNLTGNAESAPQGAPSGENVVISKSETTTPASVLDTMQSGKRVPAADVKAGADLDAINAAFDAGKADIDASGKLFLVNENEHIDRRDYGNVSARSVNAFQFDHPGLHDYYVKAAQALYDDLANAERGGQIVEIPPAFDEPGLNSTYLRTKRVATPEVAELLDDASLSYDEIAKALDAIIQNHGQENYAAAKKVEVMLDRMLTNGYTTSYGEVAAPNAQYIADKATYAGAVQQTQGDALADVDALPTERNDGLGGADAGTLNSGFQKMQAQSDEFHPINENAAQREVETLGRAPEEVPTVNPFTGQNISKTVSTILNSEITSNDMVPILEQAVSGGKFDYMPVTDKGAMAQAEQTMQKLGGYKSAATDFLAKAQFGRTTKNDFALGVACYNEAVSAGDTVTAFQLADAIGEAAHTSAQTVQAVNLFNRLTPAGKLLTLKNHLRRVNAKNAQSAKPKKAAATTKYADNLDALESGRPDLALYLDEDLATAYLLAETDEARAAAWQNIINDIASKMPPTAAEKWNYWRYTSMLTNPVTHVRNTVGNTVQDGLRRVKNAVGVVMERAIPQEQRTKARLTNSESDKALRDYARSLYEQDRNAAMGVGKYSEKGASGVAMEIQNARKMFGEKFAIGKAVQKIGDVNTAALEAEDLIFNRGAYVDSLAQALKARGITYEMAVDGQHTDAVDEARAYAIREAAKATYRDSNAFSNFVSNLGKTGYKPADALVDALLPFRRTPANILVRGTVDYSPLALGKAFAQVRSGADAADVVDTLASGLTGTGVLALGAYLTAEGLLHIKAGGDEREEDFLKASGYQDFAVQIGDKSYTLDWLVPAAMPLFAGSAIMTAGEERGLDLLTFLSLIGSSATDVVLETSMLQSINNMIENMSYAKSPFWFTISSAITSYLSQAVPTIGGKVASALDDTARKAYTQGGKSDAETDASYFVQSIARKVPGGREQLQPSIDLWGREVSNGGAAERFAEAFVSPGFFSTADTGAVTQELQRLAGSAGSTVYPSKAARSFKVGGETKYLTAEEYTQFAKSVGTTRYGILDKLTRDSRYKAMSDADKADVISDVYEYANAKAKSEISAYEPTSWVKKAMDSGNAADYIITRKLDNDAAAAAKEKKAAAWEKTLTSLKPYGVTQKVLDNADKNGGGVNQAELDAYLKTRGDLSLAEKQMIWMSVGGWKTSYADYAKKHK